MSAIIEKTFQLLACTECGAEAFASCNCHKPYTPREIAAKAVAASPNKSNRAIAAQIDVSEPTVRRARTASGDAVDTPRIGLDGRKRKLPVRPYLVHVSHRDEKPVVVDVKIEEPTEIKADDIDGLRSAWRNVELATDKVGLRAAIEALITQATFLLQEMDEMQ